MLTDTHFLNQCYSQSILTTEEMLAGQAGQYPQDEDPDRTEDQLTG